MRYAGGFDSADLITVADGIRNVVLVAMWPQAMPPRYAGHTA